MHVVQFLFSYFFPSAYKYPGPYLFYIYPLKQDKVAVTKIPIFSLMFFRLACLFTFINYICLVNYMKIFKIRKTQSNQKKKESYIRNNQSYILPGVSCQWNLLPC
jgi:hypothetical protein